MTNKTIKDTITNVGTSVDGVNYTTTDFDYTVEAIDLEDTTIIVTLLGEQFSLEQIEKLLEDMKYLQLKLC